MMNSTTPMSQEPQICIFSESSRLRKGWLLGAAFAAVIILTMFVQLKMGICTDQIWLMSLCDRLLDGQIAYVDFIENSPPFAILLYMPPVIVARFFSAPQEFIFIVYVIGIALGSLFFCGYVLARARRFSSVGETGGIAAFVSVLLLPSANFGQRDHIALLLALPLVTILAVRADSLPPSRLAALAAGILGGLVLAVRPDFALSFGLIVAFIGAKSGVRSLFRYYELYAVTLSALVSLIVSVAAFPNYFAKMVPIIRDVYFQTHSDWTQLLLGPGLISVSILITSTFHQQMPVQKSAIVSILSAAVIGVVISFLLQRKNFGSHIYPAIALALLTFAITMGRRLAKFDAIVAAIFSVWLVVDSLTRKNMIAVDVILLLGLLTAVLCVYRCIGRRFPIESIARQAQLLSITCAYLGLGLGVWFLQFEWRESMPFLNEVRSIGVHPKIAAIAHIGQIGLPLTNRVEGQWVSGVFGLIVTDNADRIIATQQIDAATREKLEKYKAFERQVFFSSVGRDPPDIVIVEDQWAEKHFDYPEAKAWLTRYARQAKTSGDIIGAPIEVSLYVKAKAGPRSPPK